MNKLFNQVKPTWLKQIFTTLKLKLIFNIWYFISPMRIRKLILNQGQICKYRNI